jgi:hypothetical protein
MHKKIGDKNEGEEKVKYAVSKTRNSAFDYDRNKKLVVFEERETVLTIT